MNTIAISDTNPVSNNINPTDTVEGEVVFPAQPVILINDVAIRLGVWLSGLQSFLQIRNYSFGDNNRAKASTRDWTQEFHLTNSTLLLCSKLNLQLLKFLETQELKNQDVSNEEGVSEPGKFLFSFAEVSELAEILKHSILLNEALLRSAPLKFTEWVAWSMALSDKFDKARALPKIIQTAEHEGERFLPIELQNVLQSKPIPYAIEADLRIILPRIAKVLKWLNVVEEMLQKDEPLKPTLLLFARIYEQTQEMISYINNRLLRFSNEDDPIFAALDATIYAASIESRKVFNFELGGLAEIRQAPRIYAKIETSYALLNDSFQQTLVNFAQIIDPNVDPYKIFPNFKDKLGQSLALRQSLWNIKIEVSKVEQNPETASTEELYEKLNYFLKENLYFLFYKDCETVERFVEEVLRTNSKSDLVPILHRFGAYLETLFGQVNMRVLLANHPFEYPSQEV